MKKNILITITIAISAHLNAMESQTLPCLFYKLNADVINLIVSFLTFDDVESEEEFIERKKEFHKKREFPSSWLKKHQDVDNMLLCVYSPHNGICAMTYISAMKEPNLIIVDTKTAQKLYNLQLIQNITNRSMEKHVQQLAISSNGNIVAIIYKNKINEDIGQRIFIEIDNLRTKKKEYPHCPKNIETIAFNKQGTHLIMHSTKYDLASNTLVLEHTIFPLTTTLDNNHTVPEKTLIRYFQQKMICKNFMLQSQNSSII
jgi:hypothetical protein